jgi:hypothetical protein
VHVSGGLRFTIKIIICSPIEVSAMSCPVQKIALNTNIDVLVGEQRPSLRHEYVLRRGM